MDLYIVGGREGAGAAGKEGICGRPACLPDWSNCLQAGAMCLGACVQKCLREGRDC